MPVGLKNLLSFHLGGGLGFVTRRKSGSLYGSNQIIRIRSTERKHNIRDCPQKDPLERAAGSTVKKLRRASSKVVTSFKKNGFTPAGRVKEAADMGRREWGA